MEYILGAHMSYSIFYMKGWELSTLVSKEDLWIHSYKQSRVLLSFLFH